MTKRLLLDILERTFWTFIQGTSSTLLLAGFLGIDAWKAAIVGGLAAVIAMVKGIAASRLGEVGTAATLPGVVAPVGTVVGTVTTTTGRVVGDVVGTVSEILDGGDDAGRSPSH